ncbi:LysR family transcriptional regulator [Parasalinivibrio latis]|uniref:LysR family transcriptional regulator n=1 Tax=Parasalinivibrio latis TaxID=2952610 RepID=UPI0030DEBF6D
MRSQRYPHLPPMETLIAFEAAAEHESFAKAGKELFLSASAVAYQIKKLEHSLGVSLFIRHGKGVTLNLKGRDFLLHVRETLKKIEADSDRLKHARHQPLLLLTQHAIAQLWLQENLGLYQDDFPDHELEISAVSTISPEPENADMAIGYFQEDPGKPWVKLWDEYLLPVASPEYREEIPALYYDAQWNDDWRPWRHVLMQFEENRMRRSSLYTLIHQAVLQNHGVMVARLSLIGKDLSNQLLVPWPDRHSTPLKSGGYYFYCSTACRHHPVANHFGEWIKQYVPDTGAVLKM